MGNVSIDTATVSGVAETDLGAGGFEHPANPIVAATAAVVSMSLRIMVDPFD